MCSLPREFDELELMINVMAEDSQWLDSFQNNALSRGSKSEACSSDSESVQHSSQVQLQTTEPESLSRKRNRSEDLSTGYCDSVSRPWAQDDFPLKKHLRSIDMLSAEQAKELPAPEFVISNRSELASETWRLVRSAISASTADFRAQSYRKFS